MSDSMPNVLELQFWRYVHEFSEVAEVELVKPSQLSPVQRPRLAAVQ